MGWNDSASSMLKVTDPGGLTAPKVARIFFTSGCSRQTESASILIDYFPYRVHNADRPSGLINYSDEEPLLCHLRAATHTLHVRLRNRVRRLTCGNLEYSAQKNYIQPGYRLHANRSRYLAAAHWTQPLPFPGQMPQSVRLCARTFSSADGKMVVPSATSENIPAKQTAVMREKCTTNQAA